MNARATPLCARATAASGSPTPIVTRRPPGTSTTRLSRRRLPTSGSAQRGVALAALEQLRGETVLLGLLGGRLALVRRRRRPNSSGRFVLGARAGDEREQQRRARAEGLVAHVAPGRLRELCGRARPREREVVRELARVAFDLLVGLVAQLGAGAAVDGDEGCSPCTAA